MNIDIISNNISRIPVTDDMRLALKMVMEYVKEDNPKADNFSYDHIGQQLSIKVRVDNGPIWVIYYDYNLNK